MKMLKNTTRLAFTCFSLGSLLCTGPAMAMPQGGELSGARQMEVSIIKGKNIPALLGKQFNDYSVMAVVDGVLSPIPFQFDERNKKGFLFAPGGKIPVDGQEGVLEAQDELAFMYTDTGVQASAAQLKTVAGQIVSEIKVSDGNTTGFAYLVKGNPQRSNRHYTYFDRETGKVTTQKFTLDTDPKNILSWSDMRYKDYQRDQSVIDTMKIRIKARVGFIKATINNNLIPSRVVAVKNGPVRTVIEVDANISILGVTLGEGGASVTVNNQSVQFPVYATIPKAAAALSDLNIGISLDFHELDGAKVRTALGPKEPIIAGGGGSDLKDHGVDLQHDWLAGSSGKNADILAFFVGSENFKPDLTLQYEDSVRGENKIDKPERYEGGHPQVGYFVSNIPTGQDIVVGINLYFDKALWKGNNIEDAIAEVKKPAAITLTPVDSATVAAN